MKIRVNGEPHEHRGNGTLRSLFVELNMHPDRVAVMVNDQVVRRDAIDSVKLRAGDRVECLTFAGGG